MNSAHSNAYVSKNFLANYQKKKEKVATKKATKLAKPKEEEDKRSRSRSCSSGSDDEMNRSVCSVKFEDLDNDLNYSDEEDFSAQERRKKVPQKKLMMKNKEKFLQEVDTNVYKIEYSTLKNDQVELATGDPIFCKGCQAIFNSLSKVEEGKAEGVDSQIWPCEFCNYKNEVNIEDEEKPKSKQVNFIVEAAAQVQEKQKLGKQDISVIFCIDISGSMCVSKPVAGKHSIKGDRTRDMKDLMKFSDGSDQRLQGENNVTYVSRIQCVQAAIDSQLNEMAVGAPDRKIGVVTFNHEVTVIGDGTQVPQVIAGDKLNDFNFLVQNGQTDASQRMQKCIKESKELLQKKVIGLEETGPTALGPALLTAISMASQGAPGSTVVLCTDGLANIGLGAFDEIKNEQEMKVVDGFYERLGELAQEKGVTVNIVSIEGEECNIDTLSKISELTGGNVERVDPEHLTQNFANILSLPVIATNVVTKVKMHKGLEFRNEDPANLSQDKTLLVRQQGNVTEETEITFEYRLKAIRELVKMEDVDLTQITHFPFQAQITYNALDGRKCVRVITNQQAISDNREEMEKNANYNILATNAIQQSSKMAKKGNMREAQAYAKAWNRNMRSNAQNEEQRQVHKNFNNNFAGVYDMIQEAQVEQEEEVMGLKQKKGFFGKLGDKISTGLNKASNMNQKKMNKK